MNALAFVPFIGKDDVMRNLLLTFTLRLDRNSEGFTNRHGARMKQQIVHRTSGVDLNAQIGSK